MHRYLHINPILRSQKSKSMQLRLNSGSTFNELTPNLLQPILESLKLLPLDSSVNSLLFWSQSRPFSCGLSMNILSSKEPQPYLQLLQQTTMEFSKQNNMIMVHYNGQTASAAYAMAAGAPWLVADKSSKLVSDEAYNGLPLIAG